MSGRRVVFVHPGDLATPTGGYAYDRRIIDELRHLDWTVETIALPGDYPAIGGDARSSAARLLGTVEDGAVVLFDGLAFGVLPEIAETEAKRLKMVALVHHPLADEGGLSESVQSEFAASERRALAAVRGVIVTSRTTAMRVASGFGVAMDDIAVAPPGTDAHSRVILDQGTAAILSIGSLVHRKGHDVLVDALARLRHLDWTARFVGLQRDPQWLAMLKTRIAAAGLPDRIDLVGAIDDVGAEYRNASIFALASRHEGYGMVFAEALAHGLPVVGCAVGAVPEVVLPSAGTLVPADDAAALADALEPLISSHQVRLAASEASWQAGQRLPRWRDTADIVSKFLERISG